MPPKWRQRKKFPPLAVVEYFFALIAVSLVRATPWPIARFIARRVGDLFYLFWVFRRRTARRNLAIAFPEITAPRRVNAIIHGACQSLFLTGCEMFKNETIFDGPDPAAAIEKTAPGVLEKMKAVSSLHQSTGGLVFVTLHLGNWECLIHVAEVARIPLMVVARPLDNPLIHKLVYGNRLGASSQIVPKHNVIYALKTSLRRGRSVAMLGDQRAGKRGVLVPFFGQLASTHRTPAMLAYEFNRPIIVLAACRTKTGFEGLVSDPIWPDTRASEQDEIHRLARAVNQQMEAFIRKYPEQYLWAHDRWRLPGREVFSNARV